MNLSSRSRLLFIAISMTVAWIIFVGCSISVSQRLSLEGGPQLDKNEATYHFGYLTSGYETTALFSHQPLLQDRGGGDVTRMRCWVDWSSCENPPWWTRFPIRGYAVVAGQIEHSAIPKFGHFGQEKHVLRATHALLPPLPVALIYWIFSLGSLAAIFALIKMTKAWLLRHGGASP